jgi:hypothetical protein
MLRMQNRENKMHAEPRRSSRPLCSVFENEERVQPATKGRYCTIAKPPPLPQDKQEARPGSKCSACKGSAYPCERNPANPEGPCIRCSRFGKECIPQRSDDKNLEPLPLAHEKKRMTAGTACSGCNSLRLKCIRSPADPRGPCARCVKAGKECIDQPPPVSRGRAKQNKEQQSKKTQQKDRHEDQTPLTDAANPSTTAPITTFSGIAQSQYILPSFEVANLLEDHKLRGSYLLYSARRTSSQEIDMHRFVEPPPPADHLPPYLEISGSRSQTPRIASPVALTAEIDIHRFVEPPPPPADHLARPMVGFDDASMEALPALPQPYTASGPYTYLQQYINNNNNNSATSTSNDVYVDSNVLPLQPQWNPALVTSPY